MAKYRVSVMFGGRSAHIDLPSYQSAEVVFHRISMFLDWINRMACMAGNGKGANVAHVENLSK